MLFLNDTRMEAFDGHIAKEGYITRLGSSHACFGLAQKHFSTWPEAFFNSNRCLLQDDLSQGDEQPNAKSQDDKSG